MPWGSAIVSWTHQTVRRVPLASDRHYPAPPYGCFPGRPGLRPRRAKSTAMRRRNGAVVAATAWHRSS